MTDAYATSITADDVEVGDTGPEVVIEDLERTDFVKYAGASGDFNPIHFDVPYAREAGNPDVFAHGMLTAGFGAHMASDWFGLKNIRYFRVRFQSRVFPGDTVAVTGEIMNVTRNEDSATVGADLVAENGDRETVLSGSVTANVPASD